MQLKRKFLDGDDFHPKTNKDKMASGIPLTDEDRAPWLQLIASRIKSELDEGNAVVVACSALKYSYRRALASQASSTAFIHLSGNKDLIAERLKLRNHEFMPKGLLDSQF